MHGPDCEVLVGREAMYSSMGQGSQDSQMPAGFCMGSWIPKHSQVMGSQPVRAQLGFVH